MSTPTLESKAVESEPAKRGRECRVFERHACGLDTACKSIAVRGAHNKPWQAQIRDISVGGVGLVLKRRFERGVGLAIEIPETSDAPGDTLLAKVVHTTALPGGEWLMGCTFVRHLTEGELQRLVALPQQPAAPKEIST